MGIHGKMSSAFKRVCEIQKSCNSDIWNKIGEFRRVYTRKLILEQFIGARLNFSDLITCSIR